MKYPSPYPMSDKPIMIDIDVAREAIDHATKVVNDLSKAMTLLKNENEAMRRIIINLAYHATDQMGPTLTERFLRNTITIPTLAEDAISDVKGRVEKGRMRA